MPSPHPSSSDSILHVDSLHISFSTDEGRVNVVEDISFFIGSGETVALVDRAASNGILHAKTASRKKSQLMRLAQNSSTS